MNLIKKDLVIMQSNLHINTKQINFDSINAFLKISFNLKINYFQ